MSFAQVEFLYLMTAVWLLYWLLGRTAQNAVLLVAGAVFYGFVHPWFLIPLYASAGLDWLCAQRIEDDPDRRGAYLALSLTGNLGLLGWFKYANFFAEQVNAVLGLFGLGGLGTLNIVLPVGISFYTFQTMSYTIDVYRGKIKARRSLLDMLVYVSFFPQLVAGPIERAGDLLPQVETDRRFRWEDQRDGAALAMWGLFKKVVIADALAPWVDRIYALPDPSFALIWTGTLAFSVQLLADFSGYTDIARGTARMLGFRLTENFQWPYMAATPVEAWRRFHKSLSTWLMDYVYMPLAHASWVRWIAIPGVPVGGRGHVARVTVLTFLISGLWHGAAWHFVLWGLYLGLLQVAYTEVERRLPKAWRKDARWRWVTVPVMYGWHLIAVMILRASTLDEIVHHLTAPPLVLPPDEAVVAAGTLGLTLLAATPLVAMMLAEWYVLPRLSQSRWYLSLQTTGWAAQAVAVWTMVQPTQTDFLYFHF